MRCKSVFVLIFAIFFINLISASFIYSEKGTSINDVYGVSEYLKAKINISFQNESVNSLFVDSLGNYISLGELLIAAKTYDYEFNDSTEKWVISGFSPLQLNNGLFLLPSNQGNFTYSFNFSGKQLFKEKIRIISVETEIEEKIKREYEKLNNSKNQIKEYDLFVQNILEEFLNLSSIETDLKDIEAEYKIAYTSSEYDTIVFKLSGLIIPEEISKISETNSLKYYSPTEAINLELLDYLGETDYEEDEEVKYKNAIFFWNQDNLETKVNFRKILITYNLEDKTSLSIFQFEFDKINMSGNAYFILEELENLKFEEDYSEVEEEGYYYINIKDIPDKLVFSTTEDIDFTTLSAFISPALSDLEIIKIEPYPQWKSNKYSKWILFGVILFIILLVATITYFIIQSWYKRNYEISLFKNRNNLYNIMTYIQTSKKKGMKEDEIKKNLKKSNWTGEQINYALRKYEGKKIVGIIDKPFKKENEGSNKNINNL